jgi:hypothetical protein
LWRSIGGVAVARRQLHKLVSAAESRQISMQVIPFAKGAHSCMIAPFVMMDFDHRPNESIVYSEGLLGGVLRSRPDEVDLYKEAFSAARRTALGSHQSVRFVRQVIREMGHRQADES